MLIIASPAFLLNRIILFISSVLQVFCDEYTDYNITNEGLDDEPKASIFHFSEYTYQGRCATHGIIPNRPSVLRSCEENDDIKNSWIKRT